MQLLFSLLSSATRQSRVISPFVAVLIGAVLHSTPQLFAQFTTASLGGPMTDPTRAAVPDVKVEIPNKDTDLARAVQAPVRGPEVLQHRSGPQ